MSGPGNLRWHWGLQLGSDKSAVNYQSIHLAFETDGLIKTEGTSGPTRFNKYFEKNCPLTDSIESKITFMPLNCFLPVDTHIPYQLIRTYEKVTKCAGADPGGGPGGPGPPDHQK